MDFRKFLKELKFYWIELIWDTVIWWQDSSSGYEESSIILDLISFDLLLQPIFYLAGRLESGEHVPWVNFEWVNFGFKIILFLQNLGKFSIFWEPFQQFNKFVTALLLVKKVWFWFLIYILEFILEASWSNKSNSGFFSCIL